MGCCKAFSLISFNNVIMLSSFWCPTTNKPCSCSALAVSFDLLRWLGCHFLLVTSSNDEHVQKWYICKDKLKSLLCIHWQHRWRCHRCTMCAHLLDSQYCLAIFFCVDQSKQIRDMFSVVFSFGMLSHSFNTHFNVKIYYTLWIVCVFNIMETSIFGCLQQPSVLSSCCCFLLISSVHRMK